MFSNLQICFNKSCQCDPRILTWNINLALTSILLYVHSWVKLSFDSFFEKNAVLLKCQLRTPISIINWRWCCSTRLFSKCWSWSNSLNSHERELKYAFKNVPVSALAYKTLLFSLSIFLAGPFILKKETFFSAVMHCCRSETKS